MIPQQLQRALEEDIHAAPAGQTRYLMVLIDMAGLSDAQRGRIRNDMAGRMHSLLLHPDFLALRPLGAMLVGSDDSSPKSRDALLSIAGAYDTDIVQAWITSVLSPADLATHLSQACFALGKDGERYLLRYYDSLITPVLYRTADAAWVASVFAPVISWWFAGANIQHPQWHRIPGSANARCRPASPLVLTEALWNALAGDPLPHRLLDEFEQVSPDVFSTQCRGVRLAQIRSHLASANQIGLNRHDDLVAYVFTALSRPAASLQADRAWQHALQQAVAGEAPLAVTTPIPTPHNRTAR